MIVGHNGKHNDAYFDLVEEELFRLSDKITDQGLKQAQIDNELLKIIDKLKNTVKTDSKIMNDAKLIILE